MKRIGFTLLFLLVLFSLTGEPVSYDDALRVAVNWLNRQNQIREIDRQIALDDYYVHELDDIVMFYVFNFYPEGFVIVSGDNAAVPILGYNVRGTTGLADMPLNAASFFGMYESGIKEIRQRGLSNEATIDEWDTILTDSFPEVRDFRSAGPLLSTEWNQNYPWNMYCPEHPSGPGGHVYAGCVAVAMAQVMRYWSFPNRGIGSKTYYDNNFGSISADFEGTNYNWNNMPKYYATDATAELLFHLGVSVEMMYGPQGSGAYSEDVKSAMEIYFNYNPNAQLISKIHYPDAVWIDILKGQIDNNIPLYYSGQPAPGQAGHAFNCDGYDQDDRFHFNWGWGGEYDGFYHINALNPGGSSFSFNQKTIINLYPNTAIAFAPSAGNGTVNDPYEIAGLSNLYWLAVNPAYWGHHFIQTADIDALSTLKWFDGSGWPPIGNYSDNIPFTGTYDGQGNVIKNLYVSRTGSDHVGLFGFAEGAIIKDLGLTSVEITAGNYVGALLGYSKGTVIFNSYSAGNVNGINYIGGLAGGSYDNSMISNSYSSSSVFGVNYTGVISGINSENSAIINTYSKGMVVGEGIVGGLVGLNSHSPIKNSYSASLVIGIYDTGGLAGVIDSGGSFADENNYWDVIVSGQSGSPMGMGRNTEQMTYPYCTDTYANWDFDNIWKEDVTYFNDGYPFHQWVLSFTNVPLSIPAQSGDGSPVNPYAISTLWNLYWIASNPDLWDSHFRQTEDIDASITREWFDNFGWTPIGDNSTGFTGRYDGDSKEITGLFIYRPTDDYVGLFGYVNGPDALIIDLVLTDAEIRGSHYVGALVGYLNNAAVERCLSTGTVHGANSVGGLVGSNFTDSSVKESYSTADVTGQYNTGGLVGYSFLYSSVENSYSMGSVNGFSYIGGLIGRNFRGAVRHCYSTGSVTGSTNIGGLVGLGHTGDGYEDINNYWNIETSGQWESSMGSGRMTEDMTYHYAANTYLNWDFNSIWYEDKEGLNNGYPYLKKVSDVDEPVIMPIESYIYNYPNPFNTETTIAFGLPENTERLTLKIYNIRGQLVRTLALDETYPAGEYQIVWDGRNNTGRQVTSGVYFYGITTEDLVLVKKMLLLK